MSLPLCERSGFDLDGIRVRIGLLGLDQPAMKTAGIQLHDHVIAPNVGDIVDRFYDSLAGIAEFGRIVGNLQTGARLRDRHKHYLLGLGIDYGEQSYFEERLRIGVVHHRAGVAQSVYQCTIERLQGLLIGHIPQSIRDNEAAFANLLQFILKITALDMSLAVDSYCIFNVLDLERSLEDERDKTVRLRKISVTDALTNLRNHSYSKRYLGSSLKRAREKKSPLCVIMADLDRFKDINDAHGHLVGDEVLQIAAARMLSASRGNDEVCRYGGEEFLFILRDTSLTKAKEVAERVRARINEDVVRSGGREVRLSVSLGLAKAGEGDTVTSLIERADEALYAAKRAGRNRIRTA